MIVTLKLNNKNKNETFIKAKLKKQTNNDKYRVAAHKMDI